MRKFLPMLVTAFAGTIPSTDDAIAATPYSMESEPRDDEDRQDLSRGYRLRTWEGSSLGLGDRVELVRIQAGLALLTNDAVEHWKALGRQASSLRGRWEARRRELMCRAWAADRRASFRRLRRLENPHRLSYREICLEFELDGAERWRGRSIDV